MDTRLPSQAAMPQSYEHDIEETSISNKASVARSFALSSLRSNFSTFQPSHREEFSPLTSYLLALQKELLSPPTSTFSKPPHLASPSNSDQMSILAARCSEPENLSYNDSGRNWAVHEHLLNPLATLAGSISAKTTSGNIYYTPVEEWELRSAESNGMREACSEVETKIDHKNTPLRQSSLSSSPVHAEENYQQTWKIENSANSSLMSKTPEVSLDDLGNLHVEEADRKCKFRSRKTTRHKNYRHRYAIKTVSEMEIIDDGYRWRKYGRKTVKQSPHHRNYYKCSHRTCMVKKRVERSPEDSSIVITTYEGNHSHPSPLIVCGDIVQPDKSLGPKYMESNDKNLQPRNSYDLFV